MFNLTASRARRARIAKGGSHFAGNAEEQQIAVQPPHGFDICIGRLRQEIVESTLTADQRLYPIFRRKL